MVFSPSKHVFVEFLNNYSVPWAADGTNRFCIEARNDQYTTLSYNMRFCKRYKIFKKLQKQEFFSPAFLHNRLEELFFVVRAEKTVCRWSLPKLNFLSWLTPNVPLLRIFIFDLIIANFWVILNLNVIVSINRNGWTAYKYRFLQNTQVELTPSYTLHLGTQFLHYRSAAYMRGYGQFAVCFSRIF